MFVAAINQSISGKGNTTPCDESTTVKGLLACFTEMSRWIDAFPPIVQPMRYGNKAYRQWHDHLVRESARMCASLLGESSEDEKASGVTELCPYFYDSFGNATRIDYGTGHETMFLVFLCESVSCLLPSLEMTLFPSIEAIRDC